MEPNPGPDRQVGDSYRHMALGCTFAAAVIMFTAAGWALDRWLGLTPVFTVVGALVGAGLSFLSVYRRVLEELESRRKPPRDKRR